MSDYPVIITLDNHCSRKKRAELAQILLEELHEKLDVPKDSFKRVWSSPAALKGKVLIRDKREVNEVRLSCHFVCFPSEVQLHSDSSWNRPSIQLC
jgi:hypothetical protein